MDMPHPFRRSDIISIVPIYKVNFNSLDSVIKWDAKSSCLLTCLTMMSFFDAKPWCLYSSMLHAHQQTVEPCWSHPRLSWTRESLRMLLTMAQRYSPGLVSWHIMMVSWPLHPVDYTWWCRLLQNLLLFVVLITEWQQEHTAFWQ